MTFEEYQRDFECSGVTLSTTWLAGLFELVQEGKLEWIPKADLYKVIMQAAEDDA